MQEPGLQERDERGDDLLTRRPALHVARADKPPRRRREPEAERLVPPRAPEAREAAVEDLREGAESGRHVPRVHAEAEDLGDGRDEREGEGAGVQGELQRRHDGYKRKSGPQKGEHQRGEGGQVRRHRLPVLGPEDEVRVRRHVDGAQVYDQVAGDHIEEEAREEEFRV